MQISWVLLAENVVVNEQSQRMDIIGEFRRVVADQIPYFLPKFYIIVRVEADVNEPVTAPYTLTMRRPSNEVVELHSRGVSISTPANVEHVVGTFVTEIQNFELMDQGKHTITAQLGDSVANTDILVFCRRNITDDA